MFTFAAAVFWQPSHARTVHESIVEGLEVEVVDAAEVAVGIVAVPHNSEVVDNSQHEVASIEEALFEAALVVVALALVEEANQHQEAAVMGEYEVEWERLVVLTVALAVLVQALQVEDKIVDVEDEVGCVGDEMGLAVSWIVHIVLVHR